MTDKAADAVRNDAPRLDADQVAAWLRDHPHFFDGREALLAAMVLPHGDGGSVSLVERQVSLLRERHQDMRQRLTALMRNAEANHRLFEHTLELTQTLMDAADDPSLIAGLRQGLQDGFDVDSIGVHWIPGDASTLSLGAAATTSTAEEAEGRVGNLLRPGRIVCGILRDTEMAFLFPDTERPVASAAVMPLELDGGRLLIALGSHDREHFSPDMGTLFIRFIGEAVAHLLSHPGRGPRAGGASSGAA